MSSKILGVVMCAMLFAVAAFATSSIAKEQERKVIAASVHGGVETKQNPKFDYQSDSNSESGIERVKREAALASELAILKEKNLITAEFQSTFITVVIWALGVAVSIVLILVTASFFTSFKVHERDIKRIQEDYAAKLEVFNSEVDSKLERVSREIDTKHEARSQQDLDRMLAQATEIRFQFDQFRTALEEKVSEMLKSAARAEVNFDKIQEHQLRTATEISRLEINIWELKKVPGNVLIASVEGLNSAIKRNDEWSIDNFVKNIKKVLAEDFVATQRQVSAFSVDFLSKCLEELRKSRPEEAAEISSMLASCVQEKKEDS